ncbi:MAG TPA: DUF5367 family protein [Steroidobacteraceae bacterium]|nr:DUF5367 family protein [Steroidobacteraceae bacterium]
MRPIDVALLGGLGMVLWLAGTGYFAYRGYLLLGGNGVKLCAVFTLCPLASTAVVVAILHWRAIAPANWAAAALLLAIPAMCGEALVLGRLQTFMPRLPTTSVGRYAALLFLTYALVLVAAEVVTLSSARPA